MSDIQLTNIELRRAKEDAYSVQSLAYFLLLSCCVKKAMSTSI